MTTDPLPGEFSIGGATIADSLTFHVSDYGGGFGTRLGQGLNIHWLIPAVLRSALVNASSRFVAVQVSGSFIGYSYMRAGRDVGEFGCGRREITSMRFVLECTATGLLFSVEGELGAQTASDIPVGDPLRPAPFKLELLVPDAALPAAIQSGNSEETAQDLIRWRMRRVGRSLLQAGS